MPPPLPLVNPFGTGELRAQAQPQPSRNPTTTEDPSSDLSSPPSLVVSDIPASEGATAPSPRSRKRGRGSNSADSTSKRIKQSSDSEPLSEGVSIADTATSIKRSSSVAPGAADIPWAPANDSTPVENQTSSQSYETAQGTPSQGTQKVNKAVSRAARAANVAPPSSKVYKLSPVPAAHDSGSETETHESEDIEEPVEPQKKPRGRPPKARQPASSRQSQLAVKGPYMYTRSKRRQNQPKTPSFSNAKGQVGSNGQDNNQDEEVEKPVEAPEKRHALRKQKAISYLERRPRKSAKKDVDEDDEKTSSVEETAGETPCPPKRGRPRKSQTGKGKSIDKRKQVSARLKILAANRHQSTASARNMPTSKHKLSTPKRASSTHGRGVARIKETPKKGQVTRFSEEEYLVERIVGSKVDKETGKTLYMVKWAGYGSKNNTWEPKEHLGKCGPLIRAFEYSNDKKGKKGNK